MIKGGVSVALLIPQSRNCSGENLWARTIADWRLIGLGCG